MKNFLCLVIALCALTLCPSPTTAQDCTVDPVSIDFGTQVVGTTTVEIVSISAAVTTSILEIGSTDPLDAPFILQNDGCSNTMILPGGSCNFEIAFNPTNINTFIDSINIPSDSAECSLTIDTTGDGVECTQGSDCDDQDLCTTDECVNNVCENTPLDCDDQDLCTTDSCETGSCINEPLDCDDQDLCTTDSCEAGSCINEPLDCDDQDLCTTDSCEAGSCINEPLDCDDQDLCTTDSCLAGSCINEPLDCNDDVACTDDSCVDGNCVNADNCPAGQSCELGTGQCISCTGPEDCNDQDLCTTDTCVDGACVNTPIDCDDQDLCTTDECVDGSCINAPLDCDDQDLCTTDTCVAGNCINEPLDCNDDVACTDDSCVAGQCTNVNNCPEGQICMPDGQCAEQPCELPEDCIDDDPCTVDECIQDSCVNTPIDCDDQDACTIDSCVDGQCVNVPNDCDDQDACTTDSCVDGQCINEPIDCDDQDLCTVDTCVDGQCVNAPLDCEDQNECTADECVEGECINDPAPLNGAECQDATGICDDGECVGTGCDFTIEPDEGTIGTKLKIVGSGFGARKGIVYVGKYKCKVLRWNDDSIGCIFRQQLPAVPQDVKVIPYYNPNYEDPCPIECPEAFTIMVPELYDLIRPTGCPGEIVTIEGKYFGNYKSKFKIYLRTDEKRWKKIKVLGWDMDPYTGESYCRARVPDLEPGEYPFEIRGRNLIGWSNVISGVFVIQPCGDDDDDDVIE